MKRTIEVAVSFALATYAVAARAQGPGRVSADPRIAQGALAVGEAAPDFELARLPADGAARGITVASADRVRLSSFRAKRPVVLIFSSYT
jgi:hypothetical protein